MRTLSNEIIDDILNEVDLLDSKDLTPLEVEKILEYSKEYYIVDLKDRDIFTKLQDSLYCISVGQLDTENDMLNLLNHISLSYEMCLNNSIQTLNELMGKYYDNVKSTYKS